MNRIDRQSALIVLQLLLDIFDAERQHALDPSSEAPSWDELVRVTRTALDNVAAITPAAPPPEAA